VLNHGKEVIAKMPIPSLIEDAKRTLITYGLLPTLDAEGQRLFLIAAREGNLPAVQAYLALGMPIDVHKEQTEQTALIHAVEGDHLDLIRFLVASGADLEAVDWRDETALFTAVNWQHQDVLRILIDAGARTDLVSTKGFSPLSSAVEKKNSDILQILLDAGADPNWYPQEGTGASHYVRPLYFAAINGENEMVQILLNAGADPDARYGDDDRPFLLQVIANEEWGVARQFIAAGADPRATNRYGWTSWMMAVYMDNETMAQELVEAGAIPGIRLPIRMVKAALAGDRKTVENCIGSGADVDYQDMDGDTALALAAVQGHADLALWLLQQGADITLRDKKDRTLLTRAAGYARMDVFEAILARDADVNPDSPLTPLSHAIVQGRLDTARRLLDAGADLDAPADYNRFRQYTPLMWAAHLGNAEMASLLIDAGADLDIRGGEGNTALLITVERSARKVFRILVDAGADPNIPDDENRTPLYRAGERNRPEMVDALLAAGADTTIRASNGLTPLGRASTSNNSACLKRLRYHLTERPYQALLEQHGLYPDDHLHTTFFQELAPYQTEESLVEWVRRGRVDIAAGLLEAGMAVESRCESKTALMWAFSILGPQKTDMVRMLLDAGADVHARNSYGATPLMFAAGAGQVDAVEMLLEAGADVHAENDYHSTAMHWAATKGCTSVMIQLRDAGAAVDPQPAGWTPLMRAAQNGHLDTVAWLLDNGVYVNAINPQRGTALALAVENRYENIAFRLLDAGANPDVQDKEGITPLMTAAQQGNVELAQALLDAGADPRIMDNEGITALEYATHRSEVAGLLSAVTGSDLPEPPLPLQKPAPQPPLHQAVLAADTEMVNTLLSAGMQVDLRNGRGDTPLMLAAAWDQEEMVRTLLEAGADVNAENAVGETAWAVAPKSGESTVVKMLRAAGAEPDINRMVEYMNRREAMAKALHRGDVGTIQRMVESGEVDIDGRTARGWTTLLWAVTQSDMVMARLLLAAGANPDAVNPGYRRPLHAAIRLGNVEMVDLLLEVGADPNAPNPEGNTALIIAAMEGRAEIVDLLVPAGAEVNRPNDAGITPLMAAAGAGNAEALQHLLADGADVNARDALGRSVLYWAATDESEATLALLVDAGAPALNDLVYILGWAFAEHNMETGIANLIAQGIQYPALHRHWLISIQAGLDALDEEDKTIATILGLDTSQEARRLLLDILTNYLRGYGAR
jgi:ankyrin repeat protein